MLITVLIHTNYLHHVDAVIIINHIKTPHEFFNSSPLRVHHCAVWPMKLLVPIKGNVIVNIHGWMYPSIQLIGYGCPYDCFSLADFYHSPVYDCISITEYYIQFLHSVLIVWLTVLFCSVQLESLIGSDKLKRYQCN